MFGFSLEVVFATMIAIAVFLLLQAFILPAFGENNQARKRMKSRLREIAEKGGAGTRSSLLRQKYLGELSPWQKQLESLPFMPSLGRLIEQAGTGVAAHKLLIGSIVLGLVVATVGSIYFHKSGLGIVLGVAVACLPFFRLLRKRTARIDQFEEQLPDALSTMSRALKAGYPLTETFKLVGDELDDPVATEFERTFNDINYGGDLNGALTDLLGRIPSVTVMALVSAVTTQKDTGGNLAELFDKLEKVIRGRYKFRRTVKTLSAEGRLSAWILTLFPFFLGGILTLVNPGLMPMLLNDPSGQRLILIAFVLIVLGIIWMRRIVRLDI